MKSIDSNSTLRENRWVTTSWPSIDSTLKAGTTWARSGMCALAKHRGRHHGLAEEPADLLFAGVAGGAPEALDQLPGEPVDAADAERDGASHGVDPADLLVGLTSLRSP